MRFCVDPDKDNAEKTVCGLAYDVTAEHELSMTKSQSARFEADLVASGVELKRAKKEIADLKSSLARARLIPELLPLGIVLLGRDGKIIYTNDAASQIVGTDLASFEMIEDWLSHALIANDQLGANELLERWRSLVWVKGSAEVFPINTDSKESLQIEVRPKLMNDGGLLVALSEVTGLKLSDKLVRDNKESLSEMNRRMDVLLSIVSDILRLWGNDQDTETLSVTVSRIDALALLLTHTTGEEHFSSVNFGQYTSSLVKELIELAPDHSNPCVHLNYGVQRGVDSLGRARIERKEIFMPYSLAMPLALICNEMFRNIFIHACQNRDEVTVKFSIIINDDGSSGELLFSHDGVPLPADYDLDRDAGNGLKIVRSLARRIGGELKMNCDLMTEFHVGFCFPEGR
jgi:two-component sensor histidine kinase